LEQTFITTDGIALRRRTWSAGDEARGIVAIAHGYGEHAGRYGWVASRLNGAGYTVESIDARGHGASEGPRVLIHALEDLARDFGGLCDRILQERRAPLFVLGHSLGSLVAILALSTRQKTIAGVILSGNALEGRSNLPTAAIPILHLLARVVPNVRLLPALVAKDISTDASVVEAYESDPLVDRGRWRLATGSAIMKAIKTCRHALPALQVPLFVLHGEKDRMLSVDGANFAMRHAGSADKELLVCPGDYHEPLSGLCKETAVAALIAWLNRHTEPSCRIN
jgi:acylglycerol lipase